MLDLNPQKDNKQMFNDYKIPSLSFSSKVHEVF